MWTTFIVARFETALATKPARAFFVSGFELSWSVFAAFQPSQVLHLQVLASACFRADRQGVGRHASSAREYTYFSVQCCV
ncbi:hypothetical protein QTH97_32025 [Variovorax sp. J22R24]|uniref:hypothetical protein n=1 Tax=Variovorax gracilis TaxID=3053502 RepID=UPI002577FB24|nr:hypothetical protein [Variovorax sp. J22R24]MDM0109589.1 hypothetical protein [Variovorax sp. J22R24]